MTRGLLHHRIVLRPQSSLCNKDQGDCNHPDHHNGEIKRTGAVIGQQIGPGILRLPIEDDWADVVISNGVLNLIPDKSTALQEMARILKPGGRLQIGDILVQKAVPESAKRKINLWTG